MKYLYWLILSLFVPIRKILGNPIFPIVWIAFYFRRWSRESVYSYCLSNNIEIKRLTERRPERVVDGWKLNGYEHKGGFIKDRNISKLRYYLALCLWIWLDDDSRNDTFERKHNSTYISGERYAPSFVIDKMIMANTYCKDGSVFELGDIRNEYPNLEFFSTFTWVGRNSAYNFSYMFEQISDEKLVWTKTLFGYTFGWVEDCSIGERRYWKHILFKNF